MGRRPVIDWQSLEPLEIGIWCEERRAKLTAAEKREPLWVVKHARALKPLDLKFKPISRRKWALAAAVQAIHERQTAGEIDEAAANAARAQLQPAINENAAELENLRLQYISTSEKIVRGRGKLPHSRFVTLAPARPWKLEKTILAEASKHFSKLWARKISERTIRAAWDDLRSTLNQLDQQ